jgi:murein DD-endopeptidase MepM/ murein hydrolase activator NlpD
LKRAVVALVVIAAIALLADRYGRPWFERAWFVYTLSTEEPAAHLPIPVKDVPKRRLTDTWGGIRSGGRRHQGIDIFSPKGTPVLSTTRGLVTQVGTNTLGGQVVWVLGPGFEWHYYAHLDRYGAFTRGDIVQPGDVLGYVGRTGNAAGTPFHLHYGIYRRGGAANPYPRLVAAPAATH